ncbi:MAG: hypothetical protein IPL53_08935 [Ignavibacteria bacterium]|nr:hypothetical protein [Ignavibacteria bacterium]
MISLLVNISADGVKYNLANLIGKGGEDYNEDSTHVYLNDDGEGGQEQGTLLTFSSTQVSRSF